MTRTDTPLPMTNSVVVNNSGYDPFGFNKWARVVNPAGVVTEKSAMLSKRYGTVLLLGASVAVVAAGASYIGSSKNEGASASKITLNAAKQTAHLADGVFNASVADSRGLNSSLAPAEPGRGSLTVKHKGETTVDALQQRPTEVKLVQRQIVPVPPRPRLVRSVNPSELRPSEILNTPPSRLDRKIKRWMKRQRVVGFSACIVKGKKIVWSNGYGMANVSKKVPFTPDQSLSPIASITKTFTATAIMQLRDRGLLELDQDINELLNFSVRNPRYPRTAITIRHLLTHRSSITDSDELESIYAVGDPTTSLKKIVTQYFMRRGALWSWDNFTDDAPGEDEKYSNTGFALLGYLVEVLSKQTLEQYLQQNVYRPVGMNETSFYIAKLNRHKQVHGYTYIRDYKDELYPDIGDGNLLPYGVSPKIGFNEHALYSYPTLADGMIRTSVNQLANFLIAMINGGQFNGSQLLKKDTVREMLTGRRQGLAWHRIDGYWGHTGGDPGYTTMIAFKPDAKVGLVFFANTELNLASTKYVTDLLTDKIERLW